MPLNLTPTRKDKPLLGFFKDSASAGGTARRVSRSPDRKEQPAPVFRTTRSHSTESAAR